jgi:hypothetical protein
MSFVRFSFFPMQIFHCFSFWLDHTEAVTVLCPISFPHWGLCFAYEFTFTFHITHFKDSSSVQRTLNTKRVKKISLKLFHNTWSLASQNNNINFIEISNNTITILHHNNTINIQHHINTINTQRHNNKINIHHNYNTINIQHHNKYTTPQQYNKYTSPLQYNKYPTPQ